MATKDYRVRLSAEGQQEVINAFRRVQQEAAKSKQSAVDASAGFNQLKDAAHSLAAEFLGYEAALRVFEGVKSAVGDSLDFAASMGKLQEKTGLSATSLQVWAAAAKRVDVSQETVSKGLGLFAKAMGNLQQGSTKSATSLQILLGSANALKGLTTDEKLRKITDALEKMSAGSQRAKITTDLFGKAGLELLPVIDQLGGQGFDKLKDKLQSFGALLSDSAIQQAKVAEETLGDLKLAAQGMAMQFTEGLLPAITNVAGGLVALAGDADGGGSAIKEFGAEVGETSKKMIYGFAYAMVEVRKYLDVLVIDAKAAGQLLDSWHPFRDFAKINAERRQAELQAIRNFNVEKQTIIDAMDAGDRAEAEAKTAAGIKAAEHEAEVRSTAQIAAAERLAKARTGLEVERAQATLQVDKETNRQAAEYEKERWKLGIESVDMYYAHRRAFAKQLADEEKKALGTQIAAQQAALKKESDPAKKLEIEKAIAELQAKADVQRIESEGAIDKMILEEQEEREKLAQGVLTFENKLLEAQGKRHAIEIASIEHEAEEYQKRLTQAGDPNADAKVEQFRKVLTAQADYREANRQLEESEKKLGEARHTINDQAERGIISQKEQKRDLIKLDQQWQPVLAQELATLRDIAKTSGLAPLIDDADEARSKVDDLNAALNKTKSSNDVLEKEFAKSIGKDLHEFLSKGVKDSHDLDKAFENLALSVAQNFVSMLSKMMASKSKGGGGGGGGDSGGGGIFGFLQGFKPQQNAAGGEIHGPGTGTSDSVPIWASTGEYVVRAAAVKQPGIRELLQTINSGLVTPRLARSRGPGFAQGGEVASGGFVLGGEGKSGKAQLTVGLDYGLVIKSLEAHPSFGAVIVRHLSDNRRAANAALGK